MFQESLDFMLNGNWLDCLDEEFGENNIWSEELLSRWKHMSKGNEAVGCLASCGMIAVFCQALIAT